MTEFTKKFPSGLRVVFKMMPGIYSISLGVMVGVGSKYEEPSVNGYSHFIEHLLFKGTTTRTALKISEEIDEIGGQMNAYTSKDTTCYYTRTATEYMEKCFDLLSDMYFNSTFEEKNIELEKKVILEEIAMDEDIPDEVCHDIIAHAIFGDHPLGQTIVGSPSNIENSTRHSILEFMSKHYVAENTVISIAGNADFDKICEFVEKYFEKNFAKKSVLLPYKQPIFLPKYEKNVEYKYKDVEQSHIELAYPSLELGNKNLSALNIMLNIFGGGMSSILFQSVREQNGLAYSVYAFNSSYNDCGYVEIYCGTNPENLNKLYPLLKNEITKLMKNKFDVKAFEKGKAQSIGNNVLAQESSMSVMSAIGGYMLKTNKLLNIDQRIKDIKNTKIEEAISTINMIFDNTPALAYVGKDTKDCKYITILQRKI